MAVMDIRKKLFGFKPIRCLRPTSENQNLAASLLLKLPMRMYNLRAAGHGIDTSFIGTALSAPRKVYTQGQLDIVCHSS